MADTFPFLIHKIEDIHPLMPKRIFSILVDVGSYEHGDVFEQYGYTGNGPSWAEHIQAIIEVHDPKLLDHLERDEEGDTYLIYADSQMAVDRFLKLTVPIFSDPAKLDEHLSQTDPEEFFELE
ncbi:hypothetical protein HHL22_09495 [Hymenobacter sp. RP-2-7]|uniref:Uncharacterized protein n=1 Tax=Hymenobacter polaris TaxID=2682546 RepID=A0A7Y0ADR0_9BACT|nr:Imm51 family immunity protein [Hymenobacter polaris]NML65437.1 hypothetical protein [Hymenobacter polaris]